MTELTDSTAPLHALGPAAELMLHRVRSAADPLERADTAQTWLAGLAPEEVPEQTRQAVEAAELAASDRSLVRADQLAERVGRDLRSLQRLFAEHVGLSPKQVLRRYRLLEAAERTSRDERVAWDTLALDLGFSDQSHLVRDFTATFGISPARYAAQCRARRDALRADAAG
jgi:AraC-like DNA-binding protein